MGVTVEILGGLLSVTGERAELSVEGRTLGEIIEAIGRMYPALKDLHQKVRKREIQLFLDDTQFIDIGSNLSLPIAEGTRVSLVQPIAGGFG